MAVYDIDRDIIYLEIQSRIRDYVPLVIQIMYMK